MGKMRVKYLKTGSFPRHLPELLTIGCAPPPGLSPLHIYPVWVFQFLITPYRVLNFFIFLTNMHPFNYIWISMCSRLLTCILILGDKHHVCLGVCVLLLIIKAA